MLKLKRKLIIVVMLIIGITAFLSCTKESTNNDNKSNKNLTLKESTLDLASLHNNTVIQLYNQVDFSDSTVAKNMIWNNFKNNVSIDSSILGELNMSRDSFNIFSQFVYSEVENCQFDVRNSVKYSMNGTKVYTYLNQLLSIADKFDENSTVNDMIAQVNQIKNLASENLSETDLIFVSSVADVFIGSIQLWLPQDMGGKGYTDLFNTKKTIKAKLTERQKKVIGDALISDASCMAIGLEVTAWTALATGGTMAPADLVATCVAAALGSALTAVISWFR